MSVPNVLWHQGTTLWLHRHGRCFSPSAICSPSSTSTEGPQTSFQTPPPPLFWQPFNPHSIHKPAMISVWALCVSLDKTIPHSTTEHHPSHRSLIWDTKDEMLLQLSSQQKGVPFTWMDHLSSGSFGRFLQLGWLFDNSLRYKMRVLLKATQDVLWEHL